MWVNGGVTGAVTLIVNQKMNLSSPTWRQASVTLTGRLIVNAAVNQAMTLPPT